MRVFRLAGRWLKPPLKDRGGASAVEFALALPILIGMLIPTVDLGMGFYTQMKVETAAQAGALYAVMHGWNSAGITAAVTGATTLKAITVSSLSTSCGCLSGGTVVPTGCTASCPDGSSPGTYVTVGAQAVYTPLLSYPGFPKSLTLKAQSTVRSQ